MCRYQHRAIVHRYVKRTSAPKSTLTTSSVANGRCARSHDRTAAQRERTIVGWSGRPVKRIAALRVPKSHEFVCMLSYMECVRVCACFVRVMTRPVSTRQTCSTKRTHDRTLYILYYTHRNIHFLLAHICLRMRIRKRVVRRSPRSTPPRPVFDAFAATHTQTYRHTHMLTITFVFGVI